MTINVELSQESIDVLQRALDVRLTELRRELNHSDDREYRAGIRRELDVLEAIDRGICDLVDVQKRKSA